MGRTVRCGMLLLVVLVLLYALYPLYLQYPERKSAFETTDRYARMVNGLTEAEMQEIKDRVRATNDALGEIRLGDVYSGYGMNTSPQAESILQITGDGNIAALSIPSQNVWLPVYPGDGMNGMERGVIHVKGSSLPEAEASDGHVVLAGHLEKGVDTLFGIRQAEKRLDALKIIEAGDMLYLYVLDQVICYRVETVRTVSFHQVGLLTWPKDGGYLSVMADDGDRRIVLRAKRVQDPDILLRRDAAQILGGETQAFFLGLPVFLPGLVMALAFALIKQMCRRLPH
ncbi:MAG: sortase [Clostridia bacterium]|nr:sortase [Clostridia bacterium]